VPASTVQCRCEGSQQMLATSVHGSQSMADRVLGMCSVPKPLLQPLCWVVLVSSARTTLWAVVKTGSSHKQVSTSCSSTCCSLGGEQSIAHRACAVCLTPWYCCIKIAPLTQCVLLCCCANPVPMLQPEQACSNKECAAGMCGESSMIM
jgi:hypothetical protein